MSATITCSPGKRIFSFNWQNPSAVVGHGVAAAAVAAQAQSKFLTRTQGYAQADFGDNQQSTKETDKPLVRQGITLFASGAKASLPLHLVGHRSTEVLMFTMYAGFVPISFAACQCLWQRHVPASLVVPSFSCSFQASADNLPKA